MATTNFVNGTVIQPAWLNPVDTASYPYLSAVAGGSTITATGPTSYTAYTQHAGFILVPQSLNFGPTTININGLGPKAITKYGTNPLAAGDLAAGVVAYIVYDGTQFQLLNPQTVAARISGRLLGVLFFTTTTVYTPSPGVNSIIIELIGGGGGGGGASATGAGQLSIGSGGGGGGYVRSRIVAGFSGQTVTIGAAGVGVSGANGTAGGATTFLTLSAGGGGGGNNSGAGTIPIAGGGTSGVAVNGNLLTLSGERGEDAGASFSAGLGFSGSGGGSLYGYPGSAQIVTSAAGAGNGDVAKGFGGGGGGARAGQSQPAATGGNGTPGYAIIYEYS